MLISAVTLTGFISQLTNPHRGVFSFLSPAGFYIRWLENPLYDTSSMRLDPEAYEDGVPKLQPRLPTDLVLCGLKFEGYGFIITFIQ